MRNILELPGAQQPCQLDRIELADADPFTVGRRRQFKREHGVAPYVGRCLHDVCPVLMLGRTLLPRTETALTSFLTNEHDLPLPLDEGIWLFGQTLHATSLSLLLRYTFGSDYRSPEDPHLKLIADGHYDFVNIEAVNVPGLEGSANIAHMSGMEEVMVTDCLALLLARPNDLPPDEPVS